MSERVQSWEESVPADLIPAVKHLRKAYDDSHWGCGMTTQKYCYAQLHSEPVNDPTKEYANYLVHMQSKVGIDASLRFTAFLGERTPSAIFKAFYELYFEAMNVQMLVTFKELLGVGRANQDRLGMPRLSWAQAQTLDLIDYHRRQISWWIKNACDKQVYNPTEDIEERIFWRKWKAPLLIAMRPAAGIPYVPECVWERQNPDESSKMLKWFEVDFAGRLKSNLEKAVGNVAVAMAKQPPSTVIPNRSSDAPAEAPSAGEHTSSATNTLRREARKLETQKRHKGWHKQYQKLRKIHPNMSDVWYATKISNMAVGSGAKVDTIRKNMK